MKRQNVRISLEELGLIHISTKSTQWAFVYGESKSPPTFFELIKPLSFVTNRNIHTVYCVQFFGFVKLLL